jgi:hypothetical protein
MSHTPDLVALLDRHRQTDTITRAQFADAADVSQSTADRIFRDGWDHLHHVRLAVQNLPLTVAHDLLTLIAGDRFCVAHRSMSAEGCEGVQGALKIAEAGAEMGMRIVEADADKIRTHDEAAAILAQVNHIRRCCDAVEENNRKLTPRKTA